MFPTLVSVIVIIGYHSEQCRNLDVVQHCNVASYQVTIVNYFNSLDCSLMLSCFTVFYHHSHSLIIESYKLIPNSSML